MMKPDVDTQPPTLPRKWMDTDLRAVTLGPTAPCDATGPTILELADSFKLPRQVIRGMELRAERGLETYDGAELRAPWAPGTREAWQEILDGLGYLLASGDADDATFALRLGGHLDVWARKRGIYTGQHDG
jgi:hypothetical protein